MNTKACAVIIKDESYFSAGPVLASKLITPTVKAIAKCTFIYDPSPHTYNLRMLCLAWHLCGWLGKEMGNNFIL